MNCLLVLLKVNERMSRRTYDNKCHYYMTFWVLLKVLPYECVIRIGQP